MRWSRIVEATHRNAAILTAIGVLGLPAEGSAQWASWNAYWENDSFAFDDGSDARYTNGVRFTLTADDSWSWIEGIESYLGSKLLGNEVSYEFTNAVVGGQNFFTPNLITTFTPNPADRPFAGFLYGGVRADWTADASNESRVRSQHSLEVVLGAIGQPSLAETFQKTVHILRENRIPKGWDHQLRTEPVVQAAYDWKRSHRFGLLDVVPHVGFGAGTVQLMAKGGGTLRLGNIRSFPNALIPYAVAKADGPGGFEWALLGGIEWRGYAHNSWVDGGVLQSAPPIDSNRSILEKRVGVMLGAGGWTLAYSRVFRDAEFVTPPSLGVGEGDHNFGSFTIGRSLSNSTPSGPGRNWWANDWVAEIGMGMAGIRERGPNGDGVRRQGAAIRTGLAKGLNEHILLGVELNGAVREDGPPDAEGRHSDSFYITKALTLGWRPWGRDRFVVVRGGVGWGLAKVQETVTRDFVELERTDLRTEGQRGVLLGVSYGYPLGERASFGVDLSWSDLFAAGSTTGFAASYLSWGLGFKWHP